jgi:outer membrane scaffolding protein for murein synthesis (MipA/OmpV family)
MKQFKRYSRSLAATAAILASTGVAAQELIPIEPPEEINLVGLGVFSVPDYYGSTKNKAAAAPLLRYTWDGLSYVQVLGPEISANFIPRKDWRAGPLLRFRARRDDDVDDDIVGRMRPIASATELGAFVAYHMPLDENPLHKVVFTADVSWNTNNVYDGATSNLRAMYYHPFEQTLAGRPLVGNIGFGLFYGSDHFNDKYFGVHGTDVLLYPSLNGRPYTASSGLTSIKIPFGLTAQIDKQWLVTVAGRYEKLLNDAKDSPVVDQRGDANQWILGIAASYLF